MATSQAQATRHKVVTREQWLEARKALLAKEKALTRQRDALSTQRRELPWVKVGKDYVFDSPQGKVALADLFDGRSQLIVYHLMFHPDWREGWPTWRRDTRTGSSHESRHIRRLEAISN